MPSSFASPSIVRPYHADDLESLIEVFLAAIRQTASKDYNPQQIEAWASVDRDQWAKRWSGHPVWVAEIHGQVVGFTSLEPNGHLDMMYVHPNHQRQGVATLLLATVEAHAHATSLNPIYAEVSLTARAFFEQAGFSELGQEQVFRNGQWLERFRMEKRLGTPSQIATNAE